MLSLAIRALTICSTGLLQSDLHNARGDVAGLAEWHAVEIARADKHYYLYSSTFDPADYQAHMPSPRLSSQQEGFHHTQRIDYAAPSWTNT